MLFVAIFGKNVEDAFGHMRYLVLYVTGGLVAAASQTSVTLIAGTSADARVPMLGASGAIAAVLGAYLVLYPQSRVLTIIGVFPLRIRAWVFLGIWLIYQLVEAHLACTRQAQAMAGPRSSPTSAASCSVRRSRLARRAPTARRTCCSLVRAFSLTEDTRVGGGRDLWESLSRDWLGLTTNLALQSIALFREPVSSSGCRRPLRAR